MLPLPHPSPARRERGDPSSIPDPDVPNSGAKTPLSRLRERGRGRGSVHLDPDVPNSGAKTPLSRLRERGDRSSIVDTDVPKEGNKGAGLAPSLLPPANVKD